jgi:serine/threonine-protein kinase
MPAPSAPIKPGTLLGGKYRLSHPIGYGGMGAVWAALNESTSREVAVKLLIEGDPSLRPRLLREARSCGALKHPNVIDIYDVAQMASGEPFLVMELLSGETLAQLLKRRRRLDAHEAARIARDVARALAAAHTIGIVHRDLKPPNIFLHSPNGEETVIVKVLDFGVAKNITLDDGLRTGLGELVGSPAYMSPEQARADGDIDHRTDIWSLGVVLFQMVTGVRPFTGEAHQILMKLDGGTIPTVSDLIGDAQPRINDIVARCLRRDRNERFRSAAEIVRLLDPLANEGAGEEPRAIPPHSEPRASNPRVSEPRSSDPRASDPRVSEPWANESRVSEPRASEPHRASTAAQRAAPPLDPLDPEYPGTITKVIGAVQGNASARRGTDPGAEVNAPTIGAGPSVPSPAGPSGAGRPHLTARGTIKLTPGELAQLATAEGRPVEIDPSTAPFLHSTRPKPPEFAPESRGTIPGLPSPRRRGRALTVGILGVGVGAVASTILYLALTRGPAATGAAGATAATTATAGAESSSARTAEALGPSTAAPSAPTTGASSSPAGSAQGPPKAGPHADPIPKAAAPRTAQTASMKAGPDAGAAEPAIIRKYPDGVVDPWATGGVDAGEPQRTP